MNIEDVYVYYRQAQSNAKGRPYRLPKDFEKHFKEKMSDINKEALEYVTKCFNTKWQNIDPVRYFECGFKLFNNFTYVNFVDPRIIKLYIQRDKLAKRQSELSKQGILKSAQFVKKYMKDHDIQTFHRYCLQIDDNVRLAVKHYISNMIDHYFMTWLVYWKMISLNEDERAMMPYILDKYRETIAQLDSIYPFLKELKEKI